MSHTSLNLGLNPSEKGLVWRSPVTLCTPLIRGGTTDRYMDLLLLVGIEIADLQGIARLGSLTKWSCGCSLWRRGRHYILHVGRTLRCADAVASCVQTSVCALERRCFYSWRVTLAFLLKIVGLVHAWFEATLIKAEIIVLFSSINFCRLWNATSYLVWISFRIECLIMWSLKVVIDQSTLLLLP